jgi:CRISPR-associated protein Csm1
MAEQEKNTVSMAALAGLLHDVGKFAQRAGEQVSNEWGEGKTKADFGYQHALHSWHFINRYIPKEWGIGTLAAFHHRPQTAAQKRIRLADQLSAAERDTGEDRDDSDRKAHPRQVHPIFTRVSLKEKGETFVHPFAGKDKLDKFYFPLEPLALKQDVIFAREEPMKPDDAVWKAYKSLWSGFCSEVGALQSLPLEGYVEAMQALMQRYTWCAPSAYFKAVPDVSLYDHGRMTAALAVCLQDVPDEKVDGIYHAWKSGDEQGLEEPVALIIGGDISGVQDFIYTVSYKGAARMLRGRSFYLQLLTEAVLRFVLQRLGLPYTNVIYSGGGRFYLLAPVSAQGELSKIQAEVSKILLQQHSTQLYLVMGWAPLPASGFQARQLSEHWQKMQNELTTAKNRRYRELGDDLYQAVFALPEYGGNPDETCSVCGDDRRKTSEWSELETQDKICTLCHSFAETLGKELPSAHFLAFKFGEPQTDDKVLENATDILAAFGMDVQFLPDAKTKVEVRSDQHLVIWALDDPLQDKDKKEQWPVTPQPAPRWLRYTVNRVPVVKDKEEAEEINKRLGKADEKEKARVDQPMTFTHLSALSENEFRRLGVLRMDVDNLGAVFKDGLGDSFSLSRMAALSSQISLFFEGWLKRIVEAEGWQNRVYTVYSGGDDLFLLAPWEKVPPLALKIVDDFAAYTGHHPALHISGGMAFIGGKYPIYQAAEDAAEAEELAKQDGKNAFAFLNKRWPWNEFRELARRKDQLKELVQRGETEGERGGPKSILQVLRSLAKMEEETANAKDRPVWGRWMWLGAYQLALMEERYAKNETLKQKLAEVRRKLGDFQSMTAWGAAARWAQLETRRKKDEQEKSF